MYFQSLIWVSGFLVYLLVCRHQGAHSLFLLNEVSGRDEKSLKIKHSLLEDLSLIDFKIDSVVTGDFLIHQVNISFDLEEELLVFKLTICKVTIVVENLRLQAILEELQ